MFRSIVLPTRRGLASGLLLLAVALSGIASTAHAETETARLTPSDGVALDNFGAAVGLDGTTLVVGAPFADLPGISTSGAAYVFERSAGGTWTETRKLLAPDAAAFDNFGDAVAVSGGVIVVGASGAAVGANSSQGAAYVFGRNVGGDGQWGFVKRLEGPASIGNLAEYGQSVAIDGDFIVIGALNADDQAPGRAFVYERNAGGTDQWGQVANLTDDVSDSNAQFGTTVAIAGALIVVGAELLDFTPGTFNNEGGAYVFDRLAGFAQVGKRFASNHGANDRCGRVDVDGHTIVLGAWSAENGGSSRGQAYVFENPTFTPNGWTEVRAFGASDAADQAFFGRWVAVANGEVVVGSTGHTGGQGHAYRFLRDEGGVGQWGEDAILLPSDPLANAAFGSAVDVQGGLAVVGAPQNGTGVVYVYGTGATTGVVGGAPRRPRLDVRPNPIGARAEFAWSGGGADATIEVFDVRGRRVDALRVGGDGRARWTPANELPNGLYFARVRGDGATPARKLLVQR